jgi:hypothetical protein
MAARVLLAEGIGLAAICANDATEYPEDSFDNMKRFAQAHKFPFPYLHDKTQSVARAMARSARPTSSAYDKNRKLKYRGRLARAC